MAGVRTQTYGHANGVNGIKASHDVLDPANQEVSQHYQTSSCLTFSSVMVLGFHMLHIRAAVFWCSVSSIKTGADLGA